MTAEQKPSVIVHGNENVVSVGQSGGQTAHTIINPGPKYAVIGPETIAQIKQGIPAGAKIGVTRAIQDAPTAQAANQFFELLTGLGYSLDPPLISDALGYPYFKGVQLHPNTDGSFTLMIGDPRID